VNSKSRCRNFSPEQSAQEASRDQNDRPVHHVAAALQKPYPVMRGVGAIADNDVVLGMAGMFEIEQSGGYLHRIGGKWPAGREAAGCAGCCPDMRAGAWSDFLTGNHIADAAASSQKAGCRREGVLTGCSRLSGACSRRERVAPPDSAKQPCHTDSYTVRIRFGGGAPGWLSGRAG
jgi:hypothetical protein